MKQGAGFLLICPSTQRVLVALRNDPTPVWSVFGGGVEPYESPIQCAKREMIEEAGFIEGKDYEIISPRPINIGKYTNFVYRTFIGVTKHEIIPTLNYEHSDFLWCKLSEIPENRHFGLVQLLNDYRVIKRVESLFSI